MLAPELNPDTATRLLPLSIPLNIAPDQFFVLAVQTALASGATASFAAVQPLLLKLRDIPLAITTAEAAALTWPRTHPDHAAALRLAAALAERWQAQTATLATGGDGAATDAALPTVRRRWHASRSGTHSPTCPARPAVRVAAAV